MSAAAEPSPVYASALCLRLSEFGGRPVGEQARIRAQLQAAAGAGVDLLPADQRLVLDAPEGLVVVVLAGPARALETARRCLERAAGLALCIGANHGPVAAAADGHATTGLLGDGIAAAVIAAGFAQPGQLLATRAFREALAADAPAREAELRAAGTFSDASVRTHELYVADPAARARRRRQLLTAGVLGAAGIVSAALAVRALGVLAPPATLAFDISPGGEVFVDGEPRGTIPPLQTLEVPAGAHVLEVRRQRFPPLELDLELEPGQQVAIRHVFAPPAVVVFDVAPAGEVFVDGEHRGSIPALRELELSAGAHRVEVRHGKFRPLTLSVELEPDERFVVRHRFVARRRWSDKVKDVLGIER